MSVLRDDENPVLRPLSDWLARRTAKRVPTRLQYQTTECGVATLAMILAHHGRHVPMEEIRQVTGVSRDCLHAGDMVRAGQHYGLECAAYTREPDDLRRMDFPFVAHLKFIHFVVVEGMTSDRVLVNDPACGRSEIRIERFDEAFTGIVVTFRPGPTFEPGGRKDRLYADLWQRIDGRTKTMFGLAALSACVTSLVVLPLASAFGGAVAAVSQGIELSSTAVAVIGAALLARAAASKGQSWALEQARRQMSSHLAGAFLETLVRRSFAYLSYRLPSEQIKSVYGNDRIARLLSRDLAPGLLTLPSAAVCLAAMTYLHAPTGAAVTVLTALHAICIGAAWHWRANDGRS
ncbi:cysteine peptidase family C39 domain-containing protein, partial [Oceanibaculum nanhaiense]|uniref:cysteine peptidase family C39 domain-containing protein n=1 Tax=Oceanibaculum nanhaiense TaxID=1909734 RepID=UPI00396D7B12